jgi:hypothetical protein
VNGILQQHDGSLLNAPSAGKLRDTCQEVIVKFDDVLATVHHVPGSRKEIGGTF